MALHYGYLILTKFWPTDQIRSWCELTMEGDIFSEEKKLWGKYIEKLFTSFFPTHFVLYVTKQVIGHRKINNLKAQNIEDWRPTRAYTKPWELENSTNFHKTLKSGDQHELSRNLENWRTARTSTKPWRLKTNTSFHKALRTGEQHELPPNLEDRSQWTTMVPQWWHQSWSQNPQRQYELFHDNH